MRKHEESDLVHASREALCRAGALCWRNNVGVAKLARGAVRYGLGIGSADLVGCYRGRFFGVELKSATGRQSPEQIAWQRAVEQAGGLYVLARAGESVPELVARVLAWGQS